MPHRWYIVILCGTYDEYLLEYDQSYPWTNLIITRCGSRYWRFDFRFYGVVQRLNEGIKMSEQKYRKTIFICRIIAVCSALIFFILITIIRVSYWSLALEGIAEYLFFGAFLISCAGTFLTPFVIIGFKLKMQHQKQEK